MKKNELLVKLRKEMDRRPLLSLLEYGTVTSADPLVIELDSGEGLSLSFTQGDFTMPDYLILYAGDRVLVAPVGKGHSYAVLHRVRGTLSEAVIGGPNAKAVARIGDYTDQQSVGDHGGHAHQISTASSKVKVD